MMRWCLPYIRYRMIPVCVCVCVCVVCVEERERARPVCLCVGKQKGNRGCVCGEAVNRRQWIGSE
jgi:hypothetical protein